MLWEGKQLRIAVYLGARYGSRPVYAEFVKELGRWIAQSGHTLVYGGSDVGLMGELASAVKNNGGKVIGISVNIEEIVNGIRRDLDEAYVADDLHERKKCMMERADAFVIFPGSLGTLDEATDILEGLKLKLLQKPCLIYNIDGFYDPLKALLQNMIDNGFLAGEELSFVKFVSDPGQLEQALQHFCLHEAHLS